MGLPPRFVFEHGLQADIAVPRPEHERGRGTCCACVTPLCPLVSLVGLQRFRVLLVWCHSLRCLRLRAAPHEALSPMSGPGQRSQWDLDPAAGLGTAGALAAGLRALAERVEAQPALLSAAADSLAADFMQSRLPPAPQALPPAEHAPAFSDAVRARGPAGTFRLAPFQAEGAEAADAAAAGLNPSDGFVKVCVHAGPDCLIGLHADGARQAHCEC